MIHQNSKKQGDAGIGNAIQWFTRMGHTVSIPLTDSQKYDLIVDVEGELKRVQVKTTTRIGSNTECYEVGLRTSYRHNVSKKMDITQIDYLFVLCGNDNAYLIPSNFIGGSTSLVLGKKYEEFKVS